MGQNETATSISGSSSVKLISKLLVCLMNEPLFIQLSIYIYELQIYTSVMLLIWILHN